MIPTRVTTKCIALNKLLIRNPLTPERVPFGPLNIIPTFYLNPKSLNAAPEGVHTNKYEWRLVMAWGFLLGKLQA